MVTPRFSPPTEDDYGRLASQWLSVVNLVEEEYGVSLDQSEASLTLLQRILDDDLVGTGEYGLQCLGVALGRIMAHCNKDLNWWVVEDEFGRDLCIRYQRSTFRLNPITMISKRILRDEAVDVAELYASCLDEVAKTAPTAK